MHHGDLTHLQFYISQSQTPSCISLNQGMIRAFPIEQEAMIYLTDHGDSLLGYPSPAQSEAVGFTLTLPPLTLCANYVLQALNLHSSFCFLWPFETDSLQTLLSGLLCPLGSS